MESMIFLFFIFNVSAAKNTWDPGTVNQVFHYQTAANCVLIKTQPQPRKQTDPYIFAYYSNIFTNFDLKSQAHKPVSPTLPAAPPYISFFLYGLWPIFLHSSSFKPSPSWPVFLTQCT
jgi:hypothetical protein